MQRNLNLFDLLLNEIHIWEILENEHKSLAIEILARLIANAAADNHNRVAISLVTLFLVCQLAR